MASQINLEFACRPAEGVVRFVFVRHGTYDKTTANPNTAALLEQGRAEARRAGEFLRAQGIHPDLIVTTRTARTRQTAEVILETLGTDLPIRATSGGFARGKSDLDTKLREWAEGADHPPATVMFVGHHTQQDHCLAELEGSVPIPSGARGSVLVYERGDQGSWMLRRHLVGGTQ